LGNHYHKSLLQPAAMALRRASTAAAAQSARQAVPLLLALLALLTGCCGEAAFGAATGAGPEELMGPSRRLAATHSGHGAPAPPFYPPDAEQIAMYIVIAVALIIAASGGVGGERGPGASSRVRVSLAGRLL
jgi:hypothetical protein